MPHRPWPLELCIGYILLGHLDDAHADAGTQFQLAHSGKMAGKGVVIVDEDEIRKEKERRGIA